MRAVVQHEFGGPEVLQIEEAPVPEPIPTEVQVRVHAAGVNPVDFKTRSGRGSKVLGEPPFTVGWDVSGTVTELGAVLIGDADGRRSAGDVTLFDSTGLAIQDLAIAMAALAKAESLDLPRLEL